MINQQEFKEMADNYEQLKDEECAEIEAKIDNAIRENVPHLSEGKELMIDNIPYKLLSIIQRAYAKNGWTIFVNPAVNQRDSDLTYIKLTDPKQRTSSRTYHADLDMSRVTQR